MEVIVFFSTFNKKYFHLLKSLKKSNCIVEVRKLEKEFMDIQLERCSKNFSKNKKLPNFKIIELLLKNPTFLEYKKQWVIQESLNMDFWDSRISYWEPLFKKMNSPLLIEDDKISMPQSLEFFENPENF